MYRFQPCYNVLCLVLILFVLAFSTYAQSPASDPMVGSWQTRIAIPGSVDSATIQLLVGLPQRQCWYPVRISVQWDTVYQADYATLARKDARVFAWNPQTISVVGKPAPWLDLFTGLAGYWDLTRKSSGEAQFARMQPEQDSKRDNHVKELVKSVDPQIVLRDALRNVSWWSQIDREPWQSPVQQQLLDPNPLGMYLGLRDTMLVASRHAEVVLRARNSGAVSLGWNGRLLQDEVPLGKKQQIREDWVLDTGMNVILLFREPQVIPALQGKVGQSSWVQYFDPRQDSGALFVVAKMFVGEDGFHQRIFQESNRIWDGMKRSAPGEKVLANLQSTSRTITLAIWDDAEQDGDTVSIRLNNRVIADRMLVKRIPQFITVDLAPQGNVLSVIAENLGSIPPNTSILEIIDGQRRKAFHLENLRGEMNHLNIFLDAKSP